MTYIPHEWMNKELITAEKLNHIENGVKEAREASGGEAAQARSEAAAAESQKAQAAEESAAREAQQSVDWLDGNAARIVQEIAAAGDRQVQAVENTGTEWAQRIVDAVQEAGRTEIQAIEEASIKYRPGDTYTASKVLITGVLTGSRKEIAFSVYTDKPISSNVVSASIAGGALIIRQNGTYIFGAAGNPSSVLGHTCSVLIAAPNCLQINIVTNDVLSNGVNNSVIAIDARNLVVTFSGEALAEVIDDSTD